MFKLILTFTFYLLIFSAFSQELKDSLLIHFAQNKSYISTAEQNKIKNFVIQHAEDSITDIYIEGHCDNTWSDEYNDGLSLERCNTAKNILASSIKNVKFDVKPFGENSPVSDNNTSEGKALNRRVLIVFSYYKKVKVAEIIERKDTTKKAVEIDGETIEVGKSIVIKDLNFIGGRHTLVKTSEFALKKLLSVMQENPTLEIEIQGHICCSPPNEDGWDIDAEDNNLSVNRAKAIYDYLKLNGVDSTRMTYVGKKALFPLVKPEITEADRNKNRRVEVKILKY